MTQVQIAEKLGRPQSFISKYERGERRLDFSEFVELADVLGIDIIAFIDDYRSASTAVPKYKKQRAKN